MKTEQHATSHAQKAVHGGGHKSAGPSKSAQGLDAPQGGGFSSVLSSLEPDQGSNALPDALAGASLPAVVSFPGDATAAAADGDAGVNTGVGAGSASDASLMLLQLGQTMPQERLDPQALAARAGVAGAGKAGGRTSADLKTGGSTDTTDAADSALALLADSTTGKKPGKLLPNGQNFNAMMEQARAKADEIRVAATQVLADVRDAKVLDRVETLASASAMADKLVSSGLADGLGDDLNPGSTRLTERSQSRSASAVNGLSTEGAWGHPGVFSGGRVEVPATSSTVPTEVVVAEQVNYWISRDVQNAELKLDGFDGLPVEVTISMQGNEAQVDFRTDQPEVREILHNAQLHLKDSLAREGLILSGVSIGASMQEDRGAQPRQHRPAPRQADVVTSAIVQGGAARGMGFVAGKSIDVFV